jgi:WD40 repeat protein
MNKLQIKEYQMIFHNRNTQWRGIDLAVRLIGVLVWLLLVVGSVQGQTIPAEQVRAVSWSPDGQQVALAYQDGTLKLYNAASAALALTINAHTSPFYTLAWSPDGALIASGGDNALRVWAAVTGALVYEYREVGDDILVVAWKPDGSQIIASAAESLGNSKNSVVVERSTWQASPFHLPTTSDIAWSPDLTQIVITAIVGVRVINASTFETISEYARPQPTGRPNLIGQPFGVVWHPDGGSFAVAMGDGRVVLYQTGTADPVAIFAANEYMGDDYFLAVVRALRFDAAGQTLTALSSDGTLRMWDVQTGAVLLEQRGELNYAAGFSPTGVRVAVGLAVSYPSQALQLQAAPTALADAGVSIWVPDPSRATLAALGQQCGLAPATTESLVQELRSDSSEAIAQTLANLPDGLASACEADLRALLAVFPPSP